MGKILCIIATLCLLATYKQLTANETHRNQVISSDCSIGVPPIWVKTIPFSLIDLPLLENNENTKYLLVDNQIDMDENVNYRHVVKHLPTPIAVQEESLIEIEFDPTYESVVLHTLYILRNNERLDKIETSRKEIIQQELQLDHYLYNGRKTWVIFLDDVQPGDFIEFSYSRIGQNPVFGGYFDEKFYLQGYHFINHGSFRLIGSNPHKLNFKEHHTTIKPICKELSDGKREWLWEIFDVSAYQPESLQPSWYLNFPYVHISEYTNWSEVVRWGCNLFQPSKDYSSEMINLIKTFKEKSATIEEQILLALRFVQNEIRYLGFEMGLNTHKPYDPNLVLKLRSGDCKDKTLLLKSLLDLMDVESHPVLVSSWLREYITDQHPTPHLFNHVILQIRLGTNLYWVDPTISYQGEHLNNLACNLYGKGLVLNDQTTEPTTIQMDHLNSLKKISTVFEVSHTKAPSKITIERLYIGYEADSMRNFYKQKGIKVIEKQFSDYFAGKYGELVISEPFDLQDDLQKNQISIKMSYDLLNMWHFEDENFIKFFNCSFSDIGAALDFNIDPKRKIPLHLDYPCHIIECISVINKEKDWNLQPSQTQFKSDEIAFQSDVKVKGRDLVMTSELKFLENHVPLKSIVKHQKFLKDVEHVIFL